MKYYIMTLDRKWIILYNEPFKVGFFGYQYILGPNICRKTLEEFITIKLINLYFIKKLIDNITSGSTIALIYVNVFGRHYADNLYFQPLEVVTRYHKPQFFM